MSSEHYFSASPDSAMRRRDIDVVLEGHRRTVVTAGGIFSPEGIDRGTQVLLRHAPDPAAAGHLLDIGCGWGPIALTLALRSPEATVWAVDVNERARLLCAENAARLGLDNIEVMAPEQVPSGVRFETIWSNPPIRVGKQVLHDLLQLWLPRLADDAEAWLVVQKNLGADSLLTWVRSMLASVGEDFTADRPETDKGYRLLRVSRQSRG
ncbi:class I SAM-dependent methyltransferase [Nesterenkonia aerolata]|uniref:Methyltransferase n=1 Tax=Nesterenkonia aerolata TaxID=3074079 RepID=A0ABU2DN93_9MICC|nr:methyltransferase [Nesterenkonia sp. LY-0111]MDR8017968.1 methyltransferase [Nesterenkonia sp. LY-0111]